MKENTGATLPVRRPDHEHGRNPETANANTLIAGGLGIVALGLISSSIGGAVCPACIVAAPALLGVGAYKRWTERLRPR